MSVFRKENYDALETGCGCVGNRLGMQWCAPASYSMELCPLETRQLRHAWDKAVVNTSVWMLPKKAMSCQLPGFIPWRQLATTHARCKSKGSEAIVGCMTRAVSSMFSFYLSYVLEMIHRYHVTHPPLPTYARQGQGHCGCGPCTALTHKSAACSDMATGLVRRI